MSGFDPAYPIWAEVVHTSAAPSGPARPSGGGASMTSVSTISDVLGWRVNFNDPAGIKRALTEAFEVKKIDGKDVVQWRPRGFRIQSARRGVGAIAGAQLSLYERARVIVDQILPLLDQLVSLGTDEDREDIESILALIRPELEELVAQFGAEGGPVTQRVDTIFELLLEYDPDVAEHRAADPDTVGGQLGLLRTRLELHQDEVNTIDEELHLTKFHTAVNYIDMLLMAWHTQRSLFDRTGTDGSLATQGTLLERSLSVILESVQELYRAMNSVFVGPSEREVIRLEIEDQSPITVAELLDWVEHVAERGFDILRVGGKDGVIHGLAPTLERLATALQEVSEAIDGDDIPSEGLKTERVKVGFRDLSNQVRAAANLAAEIRRFPEPQIEAVRFQGDDVEEVPRRDGIVLRVRGRRFDINATVVLVHDQHGTIPATETVWRDSTRLRVTFDLTTATPATDWRLRVSNPVGTSALSEPFEITDFTAVP